MNLPQGVQITAPMKPEYERILTADALGLVARLHRAFEPRRQELLAARVERAQRLDAGERPDFLPQTKSVRDGNWTIAPIPADLQCRRVEITGPVERKMIINALNSGADSYMTDFEDSNAPNWDNQVTGQINLIDAIRRTIVARAGRQDLQAERQGRHAGGASARLAPRREARAGRRPARLRRHLRLRALHVPQREGTARARQRPLLLPAEDGVAPRGAPLERRLRDDAEGTRHPAGHRQGHGADRDHPRRVRDGRDPVRAARALGGTERRPLGLHLLVHQEVQGRQELLPRRPREGHDDGALHARVCAAAAEDLPQAQRAGDRRHERPDPDQERSGEERAGAGRRALRQGARRDRRLRRRLGRAPGPGADRDGGVRQGARRTPQPDRQEARRRQRQRRPTC